VIEIVGWANVKCDSFDLINWDINVLGPFLPFSGILGFGSNKCVGSWGGFIENGFIWVGSWDLCDTYLLSSSWFLSVFLMVFFVMLLVMFRTFLL